MGLTLGFYGLGGFFWGLTLASLVGYLFRVVFLVGFMDGRVVVAAATS